MKLIAKLGEIFSREKLVYEQRRELARLRAEVDALRLQNEKINRAMRRCLTCDYRLDALSAQSSEGFQHEGTKARRGSL